MPDLRDPTDTVDLPHELPRPLPPRTWRDRLDDLAADGHPPGRLLAGAGAVVVAAVVGWRLLAPPTPPPEMEIPFAEQVPTDAGASAAPVSTGEGSPAATATPAAGEAGAADVPGGEIVVHVVGAVVSPGVQRLPAGSRVVDAVDAAGGAQGDADLGRINLAGVLVDGQQVYVLRQGETPPLPPPGAAGAGDPTGAGGTTAPVDVNRASADQLEELPGVGPAIAAAIVSHREQHGPFATVDDLVDVRGIGEAKLEQLRDHATV